VEVFAAGASERKIVALFEELGVDHVFNDFAGTINITSQHCSDVTRRRVLKQRASGHHDEWTLHDFSLVRRLDSYGFVDRLDEQFAIGQLHLLLIVQFLFARKDIDLLIEVPLPTVHEAEPSFFLMIVARWFICKDRPDDLSPMLRCRLA
jgi:hypothetical protein